MTSLTLQPIRVGSGEGDEQGYLVLMGDRLVAVLVYLADEHYEELAGRWYLEAGFGAVDGPEHPVFADLDEAQDWIKRRLRREISTPSGCVH